MSMLQLYSSYTFKSGLLRCLNALFRCKGGVNVEFIPAIRIMSVVALFLQDKSMLTLHHSTYKSGLKMPIHFI